MKFKKALKKLLVSIFIGIGAALFISSSSEYSDITEKYFTQLENTFYDLSYKLKYNAMSIADSSISKSDLVDDRIVLVDIDERSLAKLGRYREWPRTHHAKVVKHLSRGGASSIMFDIMFKTADFGKKQTRISLQANKNIFQDLPWDQYEEHFRAEFNYDSILVDEIRKSQRVIGALTLGKAADYRYKTQWEDISTPEWGDYISPHSSSFLDWKIPKHFQWELLDNIFPELANSAERVALVNVIPDMDGVHRNEPLVHSFPSQELYPESKKRIYPVLALQTALILMEKTLSDVEYIEGQEINIGKPFHIYRDSAGVLQTSFPGINGDIVDDLFRHEKEIRDYIDNDANFSQLTISHPVFAYKENGAIYVDILHAQTLTKGMIDVLLNDPVSDSLFIYGAPFTRSVNKKYNLGWNQGDPHPHIEDVEMEENIYFDQITFEYLKQYHDEIYSIEEGERKYFSRIVNLFRKPYRSSKVQSSVIALNEKVIREILDTGKVAFSNLKMGEKLSFGDEIRIPIDEENRMKLNFNFSDSKYRGFDKLSYYDVVLDRNDPSQYQNKIFILGSSAAALFDIVAAPMDNQFPGVYIHMNMLENILNNNFMHDLDEDSVLLLIIILGIVCAIYSSYTSPVVSFLITFVVSFVYFIFNLHYFENSNLYLGVAKPFLTIFTAFCVSVIIRYIFEEREKKFLNATFKKYISPELIDQMVEADSTPELGGSKDYLTAYFTDIASFSTFSEKLGDPTKLVELLNEYLTAMTDILINNNGTLDKYEGDAIIAFFGAPVKLDNNAQAACETALAMQRKLAELRKHWESQGDKWPVIVHQMRMRIGINTGEIVTGNMGSAMRMNYTMMGDAVNLAARLESGAKQYGVYTMCSQETIDATDGTILARAIDVVRVVGKSEPVITYELLELKKNATPGMFELVEKFTRARELYTAMKWDEAIALFEECQTLEIHHPDRAPGCKTTPSEQYILRCQAYKESPPVASGEKWDGVYTATEK